jgi:hypothetical protein
MESSTGKKNFWTPKKGLYVGITTAILAVIGVIAGGPNVRFTHHVNDAAAARATPSDIEGLAVYRAALKATGTRIVVSTEARWLWLIQGRDTVMSVPVAVGMGKDFEFQGNKYRFETPRGKLRVLDKVDNPLWTVPVWHYYEKATDRSLEVVFLKPNDQVMLEDSTFVVVQDNQVGRINRQGNFWPFDPGSEIVFDNKIFVPPLNTPQRRVPDALGPHAFKLGDGYMIHGTHEYDADSIGLAVSHGCVRMRNEDLVELYQEVPVGTAVYIY